MARLQFDEYTETLAWFGRQDAGVAASHVSGLERELSTPIEAAEDVDISVKGYDMPVLISAMSFGSQGELAYRSYAEAAHLLNIICMNGEGGEIHDLLGRNPRNRGQQVASGRFGVNIGFFECGGLHRNQDRARRQAGRRRAPAGLQSD